MSLTNDGKALMSKALIESKEIYSNLIDDFGKENLDKYRKHFQKRLKQQDKFRYQDRPVKTSIIKFLPVAVESPKAEPSARFNTKSPDAN